MLRIRPAAPSDCDRAVAIVFESLRSFGIEPEPEGIDADVFRFGHQDENAHEVVAEVDGAVAGVAALHPRGDNEGWVAKVFVDASLRRRGAGRALLDEVTREARARGYSRVGLRTRTIFTQAVALYESSGWTRGPAPTEGPCDRTYFLDLRAV
jgi:GNAT superfamily N-acetyltransferase